MRLIDPHPDAFLISPVNFTRTTLDPPRLKALRQLTPTCVARVSMFSNICNYDAVDFIATCNRITTLMHVCLCCPRELLTWTYPRVKIKGNNSRKYIGFAVLPAGGNISLFLVCESFVLGLNYFFNEVNESVFLQTDEFLLSERYMHIKTVLL